MNVMKLSINRNGGLRLYGVRVNGIKTKKNWKRINKFITVIEK